MRTLYFLMQSSRPGLFHPSYMTSALGGWVPCPSRRLQLFFFREPPLYVQVLSSIFFFIVSIQLADLLLFFFFFLAGGYLCERLGKEGQPYRGLHQGGEVYKTKAASLTSKRAGLQAQIRELTEELVKHRSDLKHASVAMAWAEDKEKKVWKDAKVSEDELWPAREELQAIKGDLWAKMMALERARQEALEAGTDELKSHLFLVHFSV